MSNLKVAVLTYNLANQAYSKTKSGMNNIHLLAQALKSTKAEVIAVGTQEGNSFHNAMGANLKGYTDIGKEIMRTATKWGDMFNPNEHGQGSVQLRVYVKSKYAVNTSISKSTIEVIHKGSVHHSMKTLPGTPSWNKGGNYVILKLVLASPIGNNRYKKKIGYIAICNIHFDSAEQSDRKFEYDKLIDEVSSYNVPLSALIMVGDFNERMTIGQFNGGNKTAINSAKSRKYSIMDEFEDVSSFSKTMGNLNSNYNGIQGKLDSKTLNKLNFHQDLQNTNIDYSKNNNSYSLFQNEYQSQVSSVQIRQRLEQNFQQVLPQYSNLQFVPPRNFNSTYFPSMKKVLNPKLEKKSGNIKANYGVLDRVGFISHGNFLVPSRTRCDIITQGLNFKYRKNHQSVSFDSFNQFESDHIPVVGVFCFNWKERLKTVRPQVTSNYLGKKNYGQKVQSII